MKKEEEERCIVNDYADYVDGMVTFNEKETFAQVSAQLQKTLAELVAKNPPDCQQCLASNGEKEIELTMYTGTFGNIYVHWRLYESYKARQDKVKMEQSMKDALTALKTNQELLAKHGKASKPEKKPISFFMGEPGLYTLGAILYREVGKKEEMNACFAKVMESLKFAKEAYAQDELLYGNAGYLYCLLLLYKKDPTVFNCKESIIEVVKLLLAAGSNSGAGELLTFSFPRKKGRFYFGGAHGTFGICYEMMKAIELVNDLQKEATLMSSIEKTLDYFVSIQFPSGNFPSSYGGKNDKLVHFCHGAPGAIPMFVQAFALFKKETYLTAAVNAGDVVWNRGLLLKGNGICHGITGNAYSFNRLFLATGDSKWKYRLSMFILASYDPKIQEQVKKHADPTRMTPGMPDTPYSLMEGMGGTVVFYADYLGEMLFPGFEI